MACSSSKQITEHTCIEKPVALLAPSGRPEAGPELERERGTRRQSYSLEQKPPWEQGWAGEPELWLADCWGHRAEESRGLRIRGDPLVSSPTLVRVLFCKVLPHLP